MHYLLLLIVILCVTTQNVTKKQYNLKVRKSNSFTFSAISTFCAMLFFLASAGFKVTLVSEVLPYSIGFAVAYAAAILGSFLAIGWGPLSITLLGISYSLIIPTFYGIIALGEELTTLKLIGLVLLVGSLFLISNVLGKKNCNNEKQKFSFKWLVALILGFVGNGMCSIVQKMQNIAFFDEAQNITLYKSEFMILALAIVFVSLVIIAIVGKEDIRVGTLPCVGFAAITGIANGIMNLLVMVLSAPGAIDASILFPSISGGGIVLGFLLATFIYKEKLSRLQYIGYAIGTASVVLLNL